MPRKRDAPGRLTKAPGTRAHASLRSAPTAAGDSVCPLGEVHSHLEDAHTLWHQAAEKYGEPDRFRANVNACIQALRNVTWILQSVKTSISDFDTWYAKWQKRMGDDPVLVWLRNARNQVVKQGDLITASRANVTLMHSWLDQTPFASLDVPPGLPSEVIASSLMVSMPRLGTLRDAMLAVERRWSTPALPERELLEVLAHCYGALALLVDDAHVQLGRPPCALYLAAGHVERADRVPGASGRLMCMLLTARQRSVFVHLASGTLLATEARRTVIPPQATEAARRRYGRRSSAKPSDDPLVIAGNFFELAKRMLRKDGHVSPAAFLFLRDGRLGLIELRHRDRQERMLAMVTVADEAVRTDAEAVAIVSEVWTASTDSAQVTQADFRRTVSRRRDRGEALLCMALTREGRSRVYTLPFTRRGTTFRFGRVETTDGEIPNVLAPVAAAWNLVPTMAGEEWQRRFASFPSGRTRPARSMRKSS